MGLLFHTTLHLDSGALLVRTGGECSAIVSGQFMGDSCKFLLRSFVFALVLKNVPSMLKAILLMLSGGEERFY